MIIVYELSITKALSSAYKNVKGIKLSIIIFCFSLRAQWFVNDFL